MPFEYDTSDAEAPEEKKPLDKQTVLQYVRDAVIGYRAANYVTGEARQALDQFVDETHVDLQKSPAKTPDVVPDPTMPPAPVWPPPRTTEGAPTPPASYQPGSGSHGSHTESKTSPSGKEHKSK